MTETFVWQRCMDYDVMKTLYEQVIPAADLWNPTILTKHPDKIRGYVAYDDMNNVTACAVIGNLEKSATMYIDCFAIVDNLKGKKLSYIAWQTFIEFVKVEWSEVNTNKLIIEVYLQNVIIWAKVMGVDVLNIDSLITKPKLVTDTIIMGKNIDSVEDAIQVYVEWQFIESNW